MKTSLAMTSLRRGLGLSASLALGAAGCADRTLHEPEVVARAVARIEVPVTTSLDLDLLFVIDNSPAMAPHRARLLDGYRGMVQRLEPRTTPGFERRLNLHLGVVTTDVGTRGAFDTTPGPSIGTGDGSCTSDGDRGELRRAPGIEGNFLSDITRLDGTREQSFAGSLGDAFARLADVGTSGCTYARPLEAMRRALVDNPANAGFRRPGVPLAIVLVTSGDDCSFGSSSFVGDDLDRSRCTANPGGLVAVGEYVAALRPLSTVSGPVFVLGGFSPPDEPVCADVHPAPRLAALQELATGRTPVHAVSLCAPDLRGVLSPLFPWTTHSSYGAPCFEAPVLDLDPATAGLQAACNAWYRYHDGGAMVEEVIPACRGEAQAPCWELKADPQTCFWGGETAVFHHRYGLGPSAEAMATIECVTR